MARHEEPPTPQGKNTMTNLSGQNLRPSSKNGWDSRAPGPHLSPGCGEDAVAQLTEAESPPQEGAARREHWREHENLPPPRRPLKLAPLEIPKEVKESQRQKIEGIQQEATAAGRKLYALGNEPHPRRVRTDTRSGQAGSPERSPRRPHREPAEREAPRPARARLPVTRVRPTGLLRADGGARQEGVWGQAALLSKPVLPPNPDPGARATRVGEDASGNPGTFQDAGRRRLRLRRAQGLDGDQSKSSVSMTQRLSTDEGKEGPAGDDKEGQRAENVLREASRMLDKASRRHTRLLHHTGNAGLSGKPVRRMAVSDIQDAAL